MNGWNFKRLIVILAGCLWLLPATAQDPSFVPLANIRLGQNRRLDFREHRGYEGWERGIPTHVKAQYAGGMGFMVVRLRLGLRKEMPLGDRRAGRFSARGLFRPDAYDLHAPGRITFRGAPGAASGSPSSLSRPEFISI